MALFDSTKSTRERGLAAAAWIHANQASVKAFSNVHHPLHEEWSALVELVISDVPLEQCVEAGERLFEKEEARKHGAS